MTSARVFCRRIDFPVSTVASLLTLVLAAGAVLCAQRPALGSTPGAEQFGPIQPLAFEPAGKTAAVFQAQQPRPLSMSSVDFDEDGIPDLIVGYGLKQGGAVALMRGNLDALAPQSEASWLAAGQQHYASPFLPQAGLIALPVHPDLLAVADVNGDGHRDLVLAARNGNALYVLLGDGRGHFALQTPVTVSGAITALAAYRPGDNAASDIVIAGLTSGTVSHAVLFRGSAAGLRQVVSYRLPGPAGAIEIASLDSDFTPDSAIVAGGQLVVLHGAHALAGAAELETLPIDGVVSVTTGDFLFDRHAQLQLAVLTSDGTVHVLAHAGFDPTPYTAAEMKAARQSAPQRGSVNLALKAGDTGGQPWTDVEDYPGIAPSSFASSAPVMLHSGVSGSGGQDIVVLNPSSSDGRQEIETIHHAASLQGAHVVSPVGQAQVRRSSLGSEGLVSALSQRVSPQGVEGLVVLRQGAIQPEIITPASGNVLYVNSFADSADVNDAIRCTQGGAETCSLRDAITYANLDASINITDDTVDTIMVPAGTYTLTLNAGAVDANGNAETHLEILGPMTIIGSTAGAGVTISAGNHDTVFTINPGVYGSVNPSGDSYVFNATLENLTITGGSNNNNPTASTTGLSNNVGGAINWDADGTGNLTLTNCTVTGNTILWGGGGGIWIENTAGGGTGTLTLTGDTITGNSTPEEGGALYVAFPPAAFSAGNTNFSSNQAKVSVNSSDPGGLGQGGGLYVGEPDTSAIPVSTIQGSSITGNAADSDGGGIYANEGISITGGTAITGNVSGGFGGGIFHNTQNGGFTETTTITGANFTANTAAHTGGAIAVGASTQAQGNLLTVADSRIFSNTATVGANGLSVGEPGTSGAGGVTATDNWWGCNAGPQTSGDGCDQAVLYDSSTGSLSTDPNIVLTLAVSPNPVALNSALQLNASVGKDSGGGTVSGGPGPLEGLSIAFSATVGTFSGTGSDAIDSNGNATASVTPTSSGAGTASATLDNQTTDASFTVSAGPATHFSVVAPSPIVSYTSNQLTVTALDAGGNIAAGYTGTVHFTSSDPGYVNQSGDGPLTNGVGTFKFGLKTAGTQTITATDTVNPSITGTSNPIIVQPGPAVRLSVSAPATATLGGSFPFTVTALDLYGNIATGYAGTVHFTSTDGAATLPANATLIAGVGTFNATLNTAGSQTISATDTVTSSLTGTSSTIAVSVPSLVVTTAADDPGTAANCTIQTTPGTGTDAACSLRDALLEVAVLGSGNITFDATKFTGTQTITLTSGTLTVPPGAAVTGTGTANLAIDGNQNGNVLQVASGVTATVSNLTLQDALGTNSQLGGAVYNAGTLTLTNVLVKGNTSSPYSGGAGIYNDTSGALTLTNSTVYVNNSSYFGGSSGVGGGLLNNGGAVTITGSTFAGNQASLTGGNIYTSSGPVTITSSTIAGSNSTQNGGALAVGGGTVTVTNSTIAGNNALANPGVLIGAGTVTVTNSIVAGNGSATSTGNCTGCTLTGVNVVDVNPLISAYGSYGGPTQTLPPLPGSPAICAINPSTAIGTDQRGLPRTTTYGTTTCQDAGAVQTNYSIAFTTQPSNVVQNAIMTPAPAVTLDESGSAFTGGAVTIPLSLSTGTGTLTGGSAATAAAGVATYSALSIDQPGTGDVLTATLTLDGTLALTAVSGPFNVTPAVSKLTFTTPPAATVTAGGNAGAAITVAEESAANSTVLQATDTITLTVAGPSGYLKTYTATAVAGVATFNLSSAALTATGTYAYTASITTNNAVTVATATETVTAAAAASIAVVSGTPQSAVIGAAFIAPLKVVVKDQFSNPVSGASVAFVAPASGASATLAGLPATTASDGTASVAATANGTASATAYTVTASVSGGASPASFLLTNTQSPTTLTVTPTPLTPVYGQPVAIAAAIVPASVAGSVPTGTVTFYDGSTALTPPSTVASAAASYSVSVPTVGSHTYGGKYSGDTNFLPSAQTAATAAVVVGKAASTLTGPASPVSLTYGVGGTVAVTITGQFSGAGIATPSGSVSYTIGGGAPQTAAIAAGAATLAIPATLNVASYTVTVSYAGDGNYNAAAPISFSIAIGQAATTTTLTASATTVTPGQSVTFTATVTSATTGTPTGTVSFFDGTTLLGTSPLTAGVATYSTAALAGGVTHSISATYSGSTDYLPSTSTSSVSVTVAPLDFTLTIVGPSSQTVIPGSAVSYTVDVKPDYGTYAGTVTFAVSGLPPGATVTLSPPSIAATAGPQAVIVSIQTAAATATRQSPSSPATGHRLEPFALALLLLCGMGGMRRYGRNVRRMLAVVILLTAGAAAMVLTGCAGNGFFTQSPKSYSVTITATSGTLVHSAAVTLNVQ